MTAQAHASIRFQRAPDKLSVLPAEATAHELGSLSLEAGVRARRAVRGGNPKYERAALRHLERMLTEMSPALEDVAATAALLVERRHV